MMTGDRQLPAGRCCLVTDPTRQPPLSTLELS
jgi:hypothetical protein